MNWAMGHTARLVQTGANMGSSNTITYNPDTGELHVAGDPRRDSQAHIDLYQMYGFLCEPARASGLGRFLQFNVKTFLKGRI